MRVTGLSIYNEGQYFLFGWMRLCSPLIAKWVRVQIADALLMLTLEATLETYYQSLGAQQLYTKYIQTLLAANVLCLCINI